MIDTDLGATGLHVPSLGFGCAAIMGRCSRAESMRALAAAWDEGIRFFDTARSYGFGESEAVLGEFLRGRREQAVIATKFGILASAQPAWKRLARTAARIALKVAPGLHGLLQKGAGTQFESGLFSIPVLRRSVEQSLSKLGVDSVDILYLHSAPASVLDQDDLLDAISRLVEAGKVRFAGLSSTPDVVELALRRRDSRLAAMQFPCNVFDLSAAARFQQGAAGGRMMVANHPFGGAARVDQCKARLKELASNQALSLELREKLAAQDESLLPDVVLNSILCGTGIHVVIPAMMSARHIRLNAAAVTRSRFAREEISTIRAALTGLEVAKKPRTN